MPLPRPILLALLGAVLVGAAFFATRGSSDSDTSAPVVPAPEPGTVPGGQGKKAEAPATNDARQALKGAAVVTSGTFDLHVAAKKVDLTASGSFQSRELAKMPLFKIDVSARNGDRSFELSAVSTGERGYLVRGEQALVVQDEGWDALTRARAQQAENGPSRDRFHGYSKRELDAMELQGEETLAGVPVLHFRGEVGVNDARENFRNISELFEKTSLDSPLPGTLARSLSGGTVELWVGAEDHIVRRELYKFNSAAGPFELDYSRANVNEPQKISAPANASKRTPLQAGWDRDTFGLIFSALTVGVLAVEPADSKPPKPAPDNKQARPEKKQARPDKQAKPDRKAERPNSPAGERRRPARRGATTPADVERAVKQRKVVVLFFRQRGADDDAVARAVNSVRGRRGVAVFVLPVGKAAKFAEVGGANVVRAPSIVLIGRDRQPRLYEGFIDSATLAQAVTDAR